MRKRPQPWLIVSVCGAVGVLLAVTVLSGAAEGYVGMASGFAVLFAIVRGLDSADVQRVERHIARDEVGSGNYHSGVGTKRPDPLPVGAVNTPQQDQVDALERSWRASPPADD
jgi:hypothetical protein